MNARDGIRSGNAIRLLPFTATRVRADLARFSPREARVVHAATRPGGAP